MSTDVETLTEVFRALGADDPDVWARAQVDGGRPELHRFLFLKQAWAGVAGEEDDSWMDRIIAASESDPTAPYAGRGLAMKRMLEKGVSRSDIVDVVRAAQAEMLFGLCYLLEDPSLSADQEAAAGSVGWALVTTDDDFEPTGEMMTGLYEEVLGTDPTGREMRPREAPDDR